MYKKLVALNSERHGELKITPLENFKFAKDLTFIPVLANEIYFVSQMFPVVFTADTTPSLVALISLNNKNLAIDSEGRYVSRYIPAFLRKYPFSLASDKEKPERKIILIDEEADNINNTKGEQLFMKNGKESLVLKNIVDFLKDYEKQYSNTLSILKIIKDSGVLEDREISMGNDDEKKVLVKGFQVADRDKLNELDDKTLASWVRKGIINFLDIHINSLSKIDVLFEISKQNMDK